MINVFEKYRDVSGKYDECIDNVWENLSLSLSFWCYDTSAVKVIWDSHYLYDFLDKKGLVNIIYKVR